MYSILADRINGYEAQRKSHGAPAELYPWDVFEMATSGAHIAIDKAIAIRDYYFPGESLEALFQRDDDSSVLTVAEAGRIMQNTAPGEVMPEMQTAVYSYINSKIQRLLIDRANMSAMGWCLAIGRAAGVREERARCKQREASA